MSVLNAQVGLPKIPSFKSKTPKPEIPKKRQLNTTTMLTFKHSWELLLFLLGKSIKNLPKIIKSIFVPIIIVTAINIILESIPIYLLHGWTKTIVLIFVFLTASYNSIIPRSIFWIIIFTIGKELLMRIRTEGFRQLLRNYKIIPNTLLEAKRSLGILSYYIMFFSLGLGFIMGNFLTRNNRLDKAMVTYVLAIALINSLSKGNKTLLFTALRLFYKDCTSFIKNIKPLTYNQAYFAVTSFTLGLLLNSIFGIIKLDLGGYILGSLLSITGLTLILFAGIKADKI